MTGPSPTSRPLAAGDELHGFRVAAVTPLPFLRVTAYECRHLATGARLLHVHADDPENLLTILFPTPPPDDTGLPHILEHSVLCGSERFPVKDPFVELLKMSLATFLNAFTYPDRTAYPCSSLVRADFYNLARVYYDAVFHPQLSADAFRQEGHHYALAEPGNLESDLVIKGIVYNEMKGAYSDLDNLIARESGRRLTPQNAYGRDAGGDPEAIPALTYEVFNAFHRRHYHPANAYFFFYGNLPTEDHLAFLAEQGLADFGSGSAAPGIGDQPRWDAPRVATIPYAVAPGEPLERKAAVSVSWLTQPLGDSLRTMGMHLLETILLDNAASPLRRALIDSQLGEELIGTAGYEAEIRDTSFHVGLKGTDPEQAEAIRDLVLATCDTLVAEGLGADRVERALRQLEISTREVGGSYPLRLMDRVLSRWIYGEEATEGLRLDERLVELRKRLQEEPGWLEQLLREEILENPHQLLLTFRPDPDLNREREAAASARLAEVKADLAPAELADLDAEARRLEEAQSRPNPPAALATLPRLSRKDIPAEPPELSASLGSLGGQDALRVEDFTNGLNYVCLAYNLTGLPDELLDLLPLYARGLREMGAGDADYVALAEEEEACTGGVSTHFSTGATVADRDAYAPFLVVASKALDRTAEEMLHHLRRRLTACNFRVPDRLRDVLLQGRMRLRSQLIPAGHHFAALHAARSLGPNQFLNERLHGVTQLRTLERLVRESDAGLEPLIDRLEELHRLVQSRQRLTLSYLATPDREAPVRRGLEELVSALADTPPGTAVPEPPPASAGTTGLATASDVGFVARVCRSAAAREPQAAALKLLMVHLGFGYMWEEVRVKGGAYGGNAAYNHHDGIVTLTSYRDPTVGSTLQVMERAAEHLRQRLDLSAEAIEQAAIGAVRGYFRSVRASQAAGTALLRHLRGETPQERRRQKDAILALDPGAIRDAATRRLAPDLEQGVTAVLAGRPLLESARAHSGAELAVEPV
jgi:Zn-dependent M16 (insulinase) family peptidase